MKKVLLGFLCMALMFCTSVSFASDGPQTTKECVIDVTDVVATPVNMDQPVITSDLQRFDELFNEAEESFNKEFEKTIEALQNIREVEKIYYGVDNGLFPNTLTNKKTSDKHKFTLKSNRIRMLRDI